jgi:hypothetical protein
VNRLIRNRVKMPVATLAFTCLLAWPVMGQEAPNEFWPELNVFVKLRENARLFLLTSGTRVEEQGNSDGQLGVHLDFFSTPIFKSRMERVARRANVATSKLLQVRVGYVYSRSSKTSSSQFVEHMPLVEISGRFYFSKELLVTNRVRADLRIRNGEFTPRFRDRLKLERTFPVLRTSITPYAHAEAFYDWRYDAWHRFRYTAGAEWELNRRVVIEGYYVRQRDNRSETKYLNAVGLALQLYF